MNASLPPVFVPKIFCVKKRRISAFEKHFLCSFLCFSSQVTDLFTRVAGGKQMKLQVRARDSFLIRQGTLLIFFSQQKEPWDTYYTSKVINNDHAFFLVSFSYLCYLVGHRKLKLLSLSQFISACFSLTELVQAQPR